MCPARRASLVGMLFPDSRLRTRPRRLAPSTIWVAFWARANRSSVSGTSSPGTSWKLPPSEATSARCVSSARIQPGGQAVVPVTCTASSSLPGVRAAILAARLITASSPFSPAMPTTIRSLVSHGAAMPCSARYRCMPSSTRSATHSRASSRSAVRFPGRK